MVKVQELRFHVSEYPRKLSKLNRKMSKLKNGTRILFTIILKVSANSCVVHWMSDILQFIRSNSFKTNTIVGIFPLSPVGIFPSSDSSRNYPACGTEEHVGKTIWLFPFFFQKGWIQQTNGNKRTFVFLPIMEYFVGEEWIF